MSFKKLLISAVMVLLAFSLFATGAQEETVSTETGGVKTITLWTCWLDPGEEAVYNKFNETHPDIQIEWELLAFKDYATKIIASARTGQLPDILRLQPKAPAQYGKMGYLMPMNEILDSMDGRNSYPEAYLKYNTIDGDLYGVPFFSLPHLLFYRTDLLEAKGLKAPKTWDDFLAAAEAMTEGDVIGYHGFLNDASVGHMIHQWMGSNGADTFGPDLELTINSSKTRETLDFLYNLYNKGYMNSDVATASMTESRLAFTNGQAAMITTSSSFIPKIPGTDLDGKVGILPLPKNGSSNNYFAYHSYSVSKDAGNIDAVQEFFTWLNKPENQSLYWSEGTRLGDIPANKKFFDEGIYFSIDKIKKMEALLEPATKATANGWFPGMEYEISEYPGLFDTQNIYQDMMLKMVIEDISSAEATSWAEKKMKEVMDR